MVVIVVREEDPVDVGRVDQREGGVHPLLTTEFVTGVDDHRLGPGDHHPVDRNDGSRCRREGLVDDPGVAGDPVGLVQAVTKIVVP